MKPLEDLSRIPAWMNWVGCACGTAMGIIYGSAQDNSFIGFALFILCLVVGFIFSLIMRGVGFKIYPITSGMKIRAIENASRERLENKGN